MRKKQPIKTNIPKMIDIVEFCKLRWFSREWITSKNIYEHLLTTERIKRTHPPTDFDTLSKFRQGLRVLVKLHPDILVSRKTRSCAEFQIVTKATFKDIPDVKEPDTNTQVKKDGELEQMRNALLSVRRKYKEALNTNIFETRLINRLVRDIAALPPAPITELPESSDNGQDEEYILVISDSHAGEVVSSTETLGLGGYDFNIFVQRLETLYNSIRSLHTTCLKRKAKKLHVFFNGDIISGEIHDEFIKTNDAPVTLVVAETAYVYSQFLRDLSLIFPDISVVCIAASNHARLTKTKPFKQKWSNWDYLLHRLMEAYCVDIKNIKFDIPKVLHWIGDINNKTYLVLHGDSIQSWMGIPWYGINRMMWKLKSLHAPHGQIIDNVILGHFHVPGSIADVSGEIFINGSFKGADEFSIGKMGTGTFPAQWYLGTHPERGITSRYLLHLDGKKFSPKYKYEIE